MIYNNNLPSLDYVKLNFKLEAKEEGILPPFKGSLLRGTLGHSLKQFCCINKGKCEDCSIIKSCAYAYIFETHKFTLKSDLERSFSPHPYLIETPVDNKTLYEKGDLLEFTITLFGKGISLADLIIQALKTGVEEGLGVNRVRGVNLDAKDFLPIWREGIEFYENIKSKNLNEFFFEEETKTNLILVKFETPTKLIENGSTVEKVSFYTLMKTIFRRLGMLVKAHGETEFIICYTAN